MRLLLGYMDHTRKFNIVPVLIQKKRIFNHSGFKEIIASKFHLRIYVRFQDKTCGSFAVNMIMIGGNIRDKVPTIGLTIS